MKLKLVSLILFASVISVTQLCCAGQTKYAPSIQAREAMAIGSVAEKNKWAGGFMTLQKSVGGSKLVSGLDDTP